MLNFSLGEIVVILIVACLAFKPEELPIVANKISKIINKARDKITELRLLFLKNNDSL